MAGMGGMVRTRSRCIFVDCRRWRRLGAHRCCFFSVFSRFLFSCFFSQGGMDMAQLMAQMQAGGMGGMGGMVRVCSSRVVPSSFFRLPRLDSCRMFPPPPPPPPPFLLLRAQGGFGGGGDEDEFDPSKFGGAGGADEGDSDDDLPDLEPDASAQAK